MKTLAFILFFSSEAFAQCNSNAIEIIHREGFSISFGGKKDSSGYNNKNTINVPLSINGEQACFKKVSSFKLTSQKKGNKPEDNAITITPMKTEFEKIPNAHQKQYIFVEKNPHWMFTKFHTMSFVCSGGIPLSIEATSDSVVQINLDSEKASVETSMTFATGKAAENLKQIKTEASHSSETFDFFSKIYKEKSQKEMHTDTPCCQDYKTPSIISDTSIRALSGVERSIASNFTTMAENVPNGCSDNFIQTMKNYQLENWQSNESLKDYKIKKKWFSDDLVFEW